MGRKGVKNKKGEEYNNIPLCDCRKCTYSGIANNTIFLCEKTKMHSSITEPHKCVFFEKRLKKVRN